MQIRIANCEEMLDKIFILLFDIQKKYPEVEITVVLEDKEAEPEVDCEEDDAWAMYSAGFGDDDSYGPAPAGDLL